MTNRVMSKELPASETVYTRRLFVPSVAVPALAMAISNTILNLLLLEIASSFQVHEGIAAQLRTINAVAEVLFGLFMGFLAIRFKHKSLLLLGSLLLAIAAVGSFLAANLDMLLFFFFIEGAGTTIVTVMTLTLIGDLLSLNKKAKAVSWVVAAGFVSTLVGTPTISLIAGLSGWRYTFLLLVLPISIAGLFLTQIGVPSPNPTHTHRASSINASISAFRQVLSNRSAAFCLISNLFFTGIGSALFSVAFFRQYFLLPIQNVVYMILVAASLSIIGSLIASKLVNKFGAKTMTISGALASGASIILIFFAPELGVALIFNFLQAFFTPMTISAYSGLALEQVPQSRAVMMSLTRIFVNVGSIIAPAIGGALLVLLSAQSVQISYQAVGLTFGIMNVIAAIILYFFTHDPTKQHLHSKMTQS